MYQIIYIDNCIDREKYDIYEKKIEVKEDADKLYAELFALVKESMMEEFDGLISINPDMALVLQQIKDVVKELNVDDEIELKTQESPILVMGAGKLEFTFLNRHIVLKLEKD